MEKKYCITMQYIYILTKYLNELKNTALQCKVYIFWQNTSMNWFASLIFCAQDPAMSPYFGYTLGCPSTEEADQLQRYTITRGSVGWACVAHLSFCFEETSIGAFHQISIHLAKQFQSRRFLEINQSETRIACGGHVC